MMFRHQKLGMSVLICGTCAFSSATLAQRDPQSFLNQQRGVEEQLRRDMDQQRTPDQKVDFDWGGWYSFYLFQFDDGINSSRTFRQHDTRLWGSASFDEGAHQFYGRLKLQYQDFNHGDSYDRNEDDVVGPNLDRGYYQFDLRQAARAYFSDNLEWNLRVKAGRDLVEFGTGYALSLPMDHVLITADIAKLEITGLGGTTIRSMDDIDRTRPNSGSMERNFWGTQIAYTGIEKHKPFIYAFWNKDQKSEPPIPLFQDFDYDTWYIGLGSTGELLRNLRYSTEWVFEGGDSYGNRKFLQADDVCAWAFDVGLEYLMQKPWKPRISGEYMFASGDGDRFGSPTDALGGNTRGNDTSFVGFGWRDTGLSLAPALSNLHIWRAGAAVTPFESIEWLKKLELGTDWFLYWKNHSDGAISDPTADRQSGHVGWEMDYFANWRITSDVSWTVRFGTFFPGSSFSDETTRTFFLTGVTWSF